MGSAVQFGDSLLRFDPEPFARSLRRARDREALAQVRLDERLAEQGLERFGLEMSQTRLELELEKARLLALPGVGLRGALDQKRDWPWKRRAKQRRTSSSGPRLNSRWKNCAWSAA